MNRGDIKTVCWHILENCMVIHSRQVLSHDDEKLANIVEDSIEDFRQMMEAAELTKNTHLRNRGDK